MVIHGLPIGGFTVVGLPSRGQPPSVSASPAPASIRTNAVRVRILVHVVRVLCIGVISSSTVRSACGLGRPSGRPVLSPSEPGQQEVRRARVSSAQTPAGAAGACAPACRVRPSRAKRGADLNRSTRSRGGPWGWQPRSGSRRCGLGRTPCVLRLGPQVVARRRPGPAAFAVRGPDPL